MNSSKPFHMGDVKVWYDKNTDTYLPYSEMSKTELQKCLHLAQKREQQIRVKMHVFTKIIEDIDAEVDKRGFELEDIPNDFYKNTRLLQAKIKSLKQ